MEGESSARHGKRRTPTMPSTFFLSAARPKWMAATPNRRKLNTRFIMATISTAVLPQIAPATGIPMNATFGR